MLSHELRTPLTPVLMALHLLGRRSDLPAAAREALAMIQRNVNWRRASSTTCST